MRKPVIAGNWKMHKNITETQEFIEKLNSELTLVLDIEVIICPPFTCLQAAVDICRGTAIRVSGQNMHWEKNGAYTGEISPIMLKELGVTYCIIGHSERRQYFAESNRTVNKKIKAALKHEIIPIICVGETLDERENGLVFAVIKQQVTEVLEGLNSSQVAGLIIAYEPIWAIGTGRTATAEDAEEIIVKIRSVITEVFGKESGQQVRILYGGSVRSDNIAGLMEKEDIDGALVGGASLQVESFLKLIRY